MAAISYTLTLGAPLESVVTGVNAPSAGQIEVRFDQTTTTVTDAQYPGGRAVKKGELQQMIRILEEKLINDVNIAQ